MTPKHHALLSSIAAIKDAAADEYQALMAKLDALEAELAGLSIGKGLGEIRDGITRLSHSVVSAHDTAAVLAEPMHMANVPTTLVEPVVEGTPILAEPAPATEASKTVSRKGSAQIVRDVRTLDDPTAETASAMNRNGGKAEA